jgi:hypothetical protein
MEERYRKAAEKFSERYKKNPHVIGILITGSVVHSTPDKNSDIDIQIILDKADWRERGNTWVDGMEVEYFMNPVKQIRKYFKGEGGKHTAHMLANSTIIYRKGKAVDQLIKEAKAILAKKPPAMSKVQKENAKYQLDDNFKDLEDVYLNEDWFAFELQAHELLYSCLSTFCAYNRIVPEKIKRLRQQLTFIDKEFAGLYAAAMEKDTARKFQALRKLTAYTEKLVGGKRPREWKLRGPLTKK